jgi:peptidoglycan/xylan/chitin deacetylase (PgdA/CDA1 family)
MRSHLASLAAAVAVVVTSPASAAEPFAEGLVSITLDDGYSSHYTLARPALNERGLRATYYLIADGLRGWWGPDFLSAGDAGNLAADGHEIGSHSVTHPDLRQSSDAALEQELSGSQDYLVANAGVSDVPSFASPYGAYDERTLTATKKYYVSHRTVHWYHNYRDTDPFLLGVFMVERTTSVAALQAQIDLALANKTWLVICYHKLSIGAPAEQWDSTLDDFIAVLDYLTLKGARVVTVREGVALQRGSTSAPAPTLTGVSPATGPTAGGTSVTLSGTGFAEGAGVTFAGVAVTPASITATDISILTPPHEAGAVTVTVTNPDGQSATRTGAFTYSAPPTPAPTATGVSPTSGPADGSTRVTISGSGFAAGATVTFDATTAQVESISTTTITVSTPAHAAGSVDVTVTNPDGQSVTLAGAFTYIAPTNPAPTLTSVSPKSGPAAGGTLVTLTGTGFVAGTVVRFDTTIAAIDGITATTITVVAPAHRPGKATVTVQNPDGQSVLRKHAYSYVR